MINHRSLIFVVVLLIIGTALFAAAPVLAGGGPPDCEGEVVPGHCDREGQVNGHYTTQIGTCEYVVNYTADSETFETSRLINVIRCDGHRVYIYLIRDGHEVIIYAGSNGEGNIAH